MVVPEGVGDGTGVGLGFGFGVGLGLEFGAPLDAVVEVLEATFPPQATSANVIATLIKQD